MAVLSGEVKIAMSITGTGDGAAKTKAAEKAVADLEKKVGETTKSTKAATAATSGWARSMDAIKTTAKPLDSTRSVFENLRSNLLGFPTAIAGVVTGFVAIVTAIGDAGSATERLRERTSEYAAAIEGAKKDLAELQKMNGTGPQGTGGPIGADAGDRYQEVTDKISTMSDRIREAAAEQRTLVDTFGEWATLTVGYEKLGTEIVRLTNETADLEALRTSLVNETATALERQARALREIKALTKTAVAGSRVIDLDAFGGPTVVGGRPRGGGAGSGFGDYDPFEGRSQFMRDEPRRSGGISRSEYKQLEELIGEVTGRDDGPGGTDKGGKGRAASARGGIARDIREFSAALSEALPGMSEFQTALGSIVDIWTKWGQSSISTEGAVVGSLGAIANAGAAAIKDERARAGILSIIQLGLGLGKVFIPGMQAEAAGHFAAAATLGSVAIFGSGSGGGRGAGGGGGRGAAPTRGSAQRSGEMMGSAPVSVTIHGNYYGGRREQEAASDFARLTRRRGNGFADEGRRSSAA